MAEGGTVSRTLEGGSEALFDHECTLCGADGSKQEATDFCQDCNQLLCKICRRYHNRYMKAHTLVSVASLKEPNTITPTVGPFPNVAKCQYHPDLDIEMYCGTHDMVYCYCCIAKEHRSCSDVKEIKDVAHTSSLSKLQSLVADLTRVNKQLHDTKVEMSNDLKLIQKVRASLFDEIKALRRKFNEQLDELEQKIIAELDEEQNKLEKEMGDDISSVDDLLIASDKSKPNLTSHFDEKHIFITEKLGHVVLADANNFLKKANVLKHPTLKFQPNETLCEAIEKSDRMGKINRIDTKRKHLQRSNYTVKHHNVISVRMSSESGWRISDVCQLPDGAIILIDDFNKKLKRLDDQNNMKDFLKLKAAPTGLCSVSPTEVAVRMKDETIHFISVGKSLTYQREVAINKFNCSEYGMACCNNQLWIPGNEAVYVYSLSGTFLKKIETDSQGQKIFPECNPKDIAVSNDDTKVYVAAGYDRVVVFNNNGDVIKELRDERLDNICCVCITDDDIVLVSGGFWSKEFVMFDREGNSLGELVLTNDLPPPPCALCYDSKRCRLLVVESFGNLHIFQLS